MVATSTLDGYEAAVRYWKIAPADPRVAYSPTGIARIHRVNVRGTEKDTTKTGAHVRINPEDGRPWDDERDFRRSHFASALKALGIRYRCSYNLRHARATMRLMAGVRPALAAKWLGHTLEVLFSRYAKWIDQAGDAGELSKINAMTSTAIDPQLTPEGAKK